MSAPMCRDCVTGVIHEGTPKGQVTKVQGLDTYISEPKGEPKGLIVILADALGWELPNSRVLADVYAEKGGYLVYLPDFMRGKSIGPGVIPTMDRFSKAKGLSGIFTKIWIGVQMVVTMIPFIIKNRPSVVYPIVCSFLRSVRTDPSTQNLKLGVAGFCYGGKHAVLLAHGTDVLENKEPIIHAAFTGHPSWLKLPGDIEGVRLPLSIAVGSKDNQLSMPKVEEVKVILAKKTEVEYEVVVYDGAKHGFVVRGNPGNESELRQGLEAEGQALAWFSRFLGGASS